MALFGKKKDATVETDAGLKGTNKSLPTDYNLHSIITSPRLTEKTVGQGERNVYTFNVKRDATKFQVRDAVKMLYHVTPVKINIVNKKPAERQVGSRNRTKHVPGVKKAYVYLKKGDTISLV